MSIRVVNYQGASQADKLSIPTGTALKPEAVATVIRSITANADRQQAQTKTRAAVRGGGRKPWRQKGTGRARAGTASSPLWRSGGIIFGPIGQRRAYRHTNQSVRSAALLSILNSREAEDAIVVFKGKPNLLRTKEAAALFTKLNLRGKTMVVTTTDELGDAIGVRNLASVELTSAEDVNTVDLARAAGLVFTEAAFSQLTTQGATPKAAKPAVPASKVVATPKPPRAAANSPKPAASPAQPAKPAAAPSKLTAKAPTSKSAKEKS